MTTRKLAQGKSHPLSEPRHQGYFTFSCSPRPPTRDPQIDGGSPSSAMFQPLKSVSRREEASAGGRYSTSFLYKLIYIFFCIFQRLQIFVPQSRKVTAAISPTKSEKELLTVPAAFLKQILDFIHTVYRFHSYSP